MPPVLNSLLPALFIAVVTSVLTVRLSLRRFHAERWWERKAEAYSRIVESLHHLMEYCSAMSEESSHAAEFSAEHRKELSDSYKSAYRDLRKATGVGAYIISNEIAVILSNLEARPRLDWREEPPWEVFDADFAAYKEALEQIRQLAKKDLKVS